MEVVAGKANAEVGIAGSAGNPDTSLRLERLFGMEAQFWLDLQLAWDLYEVCHSPAVKNIRKIKRITRSGMNAINLLPGIRLTGRGNFRIQPP